ncbi:outer arm dynein light chain 1 protein [Actinidia rufa]|uniref:Outer arm dynein light chain 1 protein n=1 Tax=Actinidia rufa TaxID=165716 RepID=A0A7J0EHA0_9ERIC|nr:outer arm dynein light chain 1 protein [Actinidia rufa]
MSRFNCFSALIGRKKDKGDVLSSKTDDYYKKLGILQLRIEGPAKFSETDVLKSASFTVPVQIISENSRCKVKVMSHDSPVKEDTPEVAYEGEDEHEENLSMKKNNSDFDFQASFVDSSEKNDRSMNKNMGTNDSFDDILNRQFEDKADKDAEEGVDLIQSGHVSDPGIAKAEIWASPKLKRSCSNLETRVVLKEIADQLPLSKCQSFEKLQRLAERLREEVLPENLGSPRSVMTHCSADKVMLKKHSSSQVLPSRSRRLWWKLFLWSHRNLHPWTAKPQAIPDIFAFNQQGGYCSDTLEPNRDLELDKMESPVLFTGEHMKMANNNDNQSWDGFHGGVSGFWPQNQWVAFSTESPLTRVDEWVKELTTQPPIPVNDDDNNDGGNAFPPSPETSRSPSRSASHLTRRPNVNLSEEILHANSVIQSLNSSSTVAHIMGIGLKVIPTLAQFSSLRSVNLSGNSIVHVTTGSLPKGLHILNLSRNKISTIEGFRELTRLRVLDLSYNRISRIGHGLSNCTLIKELYLAGNKISEVDGLHRLLKLTVLDLSFNKITTTKAIGQLVANYNSLLALNLVGNPIQSNISDDQLRKAVCSLLSKLAYLNKQPINPRKAREVGTESIARAALGNSSWSSRRKAVKKVGQGGSLSSGHRASANASVGQRSRHSSKSRTHHHSALKMKSSELASSSY